MCENVEELGLFRLQVNNLLLSVCPGRSRAGAFPPLQWGKCVIHGFAYNFRNVFNHLFTYLYQYIYSLEE